MPRRLLLGRAGTGKTHACLDRVVRALETGREALLLVPTYSQAEHLRFRLLERRPGIAGRLVETFSSLSESLAGTRLVALAPPAERDRAAEAALAPLFGEAAKRPGFRAEFLAVVKEVKENGGSVEEAVAKAKTHFAEGSRERNLFLALERYRLARPDHEDLLATALARLRARPERLDLLLVDGFHDFTGLELSILRALADGAEETVVTLPSDPDSSDTAVFRASALTAAKLPEFLREPLRGNRRAGAGPLLHLERRLFEAPTERLPGGETVRLLECAGDDDEADRVAREVVLSGRPYRDFLLIRRTFDDARETFRAAFRRHGVPLRFFTPEPLGALPVARAARMLCLALRGRPKEEWADLPASPYFAGDAEKLVPPAEGIGAFFRRNLGLRKVLDLHPGGDFETSRAAAFLRALASECAAVEDLPPADAAARIEARIPLLRASPPDRRHDCVYAVEALDARQWEKPVVFVTGLGGDSFPRQFRQDLFLRDAERQAFSEARGVSLPLRSRREDEERYLFYVALTRARERLHLSYAAFDEEGTPQPMSPYLEEAIAHLEPLSRRAVALSEQFAGPAEAVAREDLLPIVADGLARAASGRAIGREPALAASLADLGAVAREDLAFARRLELMRLLPIREPPLPEPFRLSASAVNDFLRCPFLYFARRLLRVEPERERELDPALRGEILHAALERCFRETGDPGAIFDLVFAERTEGLRLGLAAEAQRRWMRHAAVHAAEEMRGLPVDRVEQPFRVEVGGVAVAGRMDRVDRLPQGEIVRDYKSGSPPDLDVQLGIYLLALERPVGAIYELLRKGKRSGFVLEGVEAPEGVETVSEAALAEEMEKARKSVARTAAAARTGRLAVKPASPEECTRRRCDGFDLCRVARGRWLVRKGRDEAAGEEAGS